LEIIYTIYIKGYLTTSQIHQIFFPNSKVLKVAEQLMRRLRERDFVRSIEQAVVRGEGRKPFLWALAKGGKELLVREREIDPEAIDIVPWIDESHNITIKHLLATTDFHIALLKACALNNFTLEEFTDERELRSAHRMENITLTDEAGHPIKPPVPDALFTLKVQDKRAIYFLEVDRATIALNPSVFEKRSIVRKIDSYLAYADSVAYREQYGTRPLRVLWAVKGERRLTNMKWATETFLKQVTKLEEAGISAEEKHRRQAEYEKLGLRFRFITLEEVQPATLLTDPVWQVAGSEQMGSILPASVASSL
jgi:hypothetical protein